MAIRTIKRIYWISLGILCVVLGSVGLFIPGLPTTVFILIALWSFTKSSPRLYNWLINNRYLAAGAKNYLETGAMNKQTKLRIIATITIFCALAIFIFLPDGILLIKGIIGATGCIGIFYILRIPVIK